MRRITSARVLEVLDVLHRAPPVDRADHLATLCGNDPELRREVERLLALRDQHEGFLDGPAVGRRRHDALKANDRLGPYRLREVLGRGGMGTVYRAVREDDFEKQVALKVLRPELLSPAMVERFHTERQILAGLEHPGIAHMLDGGTTADARPYLVMAFVDGEPIDRFCAARALDVGDRMALFRQVAEAVAFAHRNLVVHRDIKPSNVLVTADGVPKLLDFGIAKLLAGGAGRSGSLGDTAPGSGAMTPRYASPEQVVDDPVTPATDVYALGLLLYTMLTGALPCGLGDCPIEDVPRRIVNARPEPVGCGADIEAIVAKALRKLPAERYGSAEALAADVDRYLRRMPVRAREGGHLYVAGKLARRHPWAALAGALFVVFSLTSTVLWREAVAERQRADAERSAAVREQERAERVSSFLTELFRSADPDVARGGGQTVREVLDEGRARLAHGLEDEPELEAALAGTLGDVYRNLGLYEEAIELLQRSADLRRGLYPEGDLRLAVALNDLASVLYYLQRYEEAEEHLRASLALRRRLDAEPSALAQAINNLASALKQQGKLAAASALYEEALAIRQAVHGPESAEVASSLYSLGALRFAEGDIERAEALLRQALAVYVASHGERHTRVASVLHTLGRVLHQRGELAEAEGALRRALTIHRELLGDDHGRVSTNRADLEAVLAERP